MNSDLLMEEIQRVKGNQKKLDAEDEEAEAILSSEKGRKKKNLLTKLQEKGV